MDTKKIILIDTNNLAYRAFYALPDTISTSTGTMTNAVFGFTSMLLKLMEEYKPDVIIGTFDSRGPTFRHEISREYKATRKKMPDELTHQMSLIKEIFSSFNIPSMEVSGFEADDIIATAVEQSLEHFDEVIIVSSDKDILQLVSEKVKVLAIKKGITDTFLYDSTNVMEKFGVEPSLIKDYLALTGDTSDNIPGVPGIGPKTAKELVGKFGTVESIYERIDKIKSDKIKKLLAENRQSAEISKRLTVLEKNLDIDIRGAIKNEITRKIDFNQVEKIFDSFEFTTLKKRLSSIAGIYSGTGSNSEVKDVKKKIQEDEKTGIMTKRLCINDPGFKKLGDRAIDRLFISVLNNSSEQYSGGSPENDDCLILMDDNEDFYYFSRRFLQGLTAKETSRFSEMFEKGDIVKSGYDFKRIYKFLRSLKVVLKGKLFDYKIMYLLLNTVKPDISAEELTTAIAGMTRKDIQGLELELDIHGSIKRTIGELKEILLETDQMSFGFETVGKDSKQFRKQKASVDESEDSGCFEKMLEASIFRMKEMLYYKKIDRILGEKIKAEKLERVYSEVEMPLISILAEIELKGVNIDLNYLSELIKAYDIDICRLTDEIYKLCNTEFNINSTKQLSQILYEDMKLPATRRTKTGYSTDAVSLLAIIDSHPVIEKILEYREKVKLKNTYIDVLPNLVDPFDGRVHTTYNQLGTTTGRISSNNPNLQNIPVRSELGKQIRKAFIPGKGYDLLMSADYSQIELRILAHLADDEGLIDAFNSGQDIHARTASEIFSIPYDEVDEELRRKAKAINFGIIYGMTEFGLKSRLSISEEEARDYIKLYFSRYPKVSKYINRLIEYAYRTGFATTMFGRKRYIGELSSTNMNIRNLGERLAVNTPIQGSAADIMKIATINLYKSMEEKKIDSNIILHVHDEIVLEFVKKDIAVLKKAVIDAMENCVGLKARLKVDIKTSENWYF